MCLFFNLLREKERERKERERKERERERESISKPRPIVNRSLGSEDVFLSDDPKEEEEEEEAEDCTRIFIRFREPSTTKDEIAFSSSLSLKISTSTFSS